MILRIIKESKYDGTEINLVGEKIYNYRNIVESTIGLEKKIRLVKIPYHLIYNIVRVFEFIGIPLVLTREEIISVNIDKMFDSNKIQNLIIAGNEEGKLFS